MKVQIVFKFEDYKRHQRIGKYVYLKLLASLKKDVNENDRLRNNFENELYSCHSTPSVDTCFVVRSTCSYLLSYTSYTSLYIADYVEYLSEYCPKHLRKLNSPVDK